MKTIIVVKDKNEKPKGHDLTKLWKQIKELDNDLTQNIEGQIKNLYNSKNDNLFNDILEVCKEQFKELRYIYEFDSIKCDANQISKKGMQATLNLFGRTAFDAVQTAVPGTIKHLMITGFKSGIGLTALNTGLSYGINSFYNIIGWC